MSKPLRKNTARDSTSLTIRHMSISTILKYGEIGLKTDKIQYVKSYSFAPLFSISHGFPVRYISFSPQAA